MDWLTEDMVNVLIGVGVLGPCLLALLWGALRGGGEPKGSDIAAKGEQPFWQGKVTSFD